MPQNTLLEKLQQLREQLESTDSLDVQQRSQLQQLVADIERALEPEHPPGEEGVLSERTNDIVLKFEAEHPQITNALNQVASALANLGI